MFIACPACQTRYNVPDSAIGADGRTVRCAKCRESWFASPDDALAEPGADMATAPEEDAAANDALGKASADRLPADGGPGNGQHEYQQAPATNAGAADEPPAEESPAEYQEQYHEPRRSRRGLWLVALLAVIAIAAAIYGAARMYGLPGWAPGQEDVFAEASQDLVVDFPGQEQELQTTEDGGRFFTASGTITNSGSEIRRVPPLLVVLRDSQERIVYSWEMMPPRRELAPGETMSVKEAMTDVPASAQIAEIGWQP